MIDPFTAATGLSAKWGFSKTAAVGLKKASAKQVGHVVQNYGNMSVNAASQQSTAYGAGKSAGESIGFFSAVASKLGGESREPRYTPQGRDRDSLQHLKRDLDSAKQRKMTRERQDRVEAARHREAVEYSDRKRARDHEAEMRGYERYQRQMAAQEAARRTARASANGWRSEV
ncbi:hypothetical protein BU16DRAFT_524782 [Lophium mytilinum]|uniref:Uncharacterized protein n=1 Tax=Lophium mytilinum TaxID=390894 RepID=A0A6A6R1X2_9PEZI|nr:hypothetical protein BU16DRAFT_524782 [Lophium mytilinum]